MNYQDKYEKYKTKYIELKHTYQKTQYGGNGSILETYLLPRGTNPELILKQYGQKCTGGTNVAVIYLNESREYYPENVKITDLEPLQLIYEIRYTDNYGRIQQPIQFTQDNIKIYIGYGAYTQSEFFQMISSDEGIKYIIISDGNEYRCISISDVAKNIESSVSELSRGVDISKTYHQPIINLPKHEPKIEKFEESVNRNGQTVQLPGIKIDGYSFVLESRTPPQSQREAIAIKTKDARYCYYRSDSEMGIWRLCMISDYGIDKGVDYVTSSFISIELQQFINENLSKLMVEPEASIISRCKKSPERTDAFNLLNDENRIYKNREYMFEIMERCRAAHCFTTGTFGFESVMETIEQYRKTLAKNTPEYDIYDDFVQTLNLFCGKKCSDNDYKTRTENFIKAYYDTIGYLMDKNFVLHKESKKYIGSYSFAYKNAKINHNLYGVYIISRSTNQSYRLIYSYYNIYLDENSKFNGNYYAIINLLPPDAKITSSGLYDKIMSVGVYIYKILEYRKQCDIEDKTRNVGGDCRYIFLGDFLNRVWPLQLLKD